MCTYSDQTASSTLALDRRHAGNHSTFSHPNHMSATPKKENKMPVHHFMRTAAVLIASIGLTPLLACEEASHPAVTTAPPAVRDELHQMLISYVHAVQGDDAATVEKLLSSELRARIEERGTGADSGSKLRNFVAHEHQNLARSIDPSELARQTFAVSSAQMLADGSAASIQLANDGKVFTKPFYFVQDNGTYKLNILSPSVAFATRSYYKVANADGVQRSFSCSGGTNAIVAPAQQVQAECENTCAGLLDGSRFTVAGASADCDYNTFGVDMTIRNNRPECQDPCGF